MNIYIRIKNFFLSLWVFWMFFFLSESFLWKLFVEGEGVAMSPLERISPGKGVGGSHEQQFMMLPLPPIGTQPNEVITNGPVILFSVGLWWNGDARKEWVRVVGFVFTNPCWDSEAFVRGEWVVDRPTQSATHITDSVYLGFVWRVMAWPHHVIVARYLAYVVFRGSVEFEVVVLLRVAEVLPGGHVA